MQKILEMASALNEAETNSVTPMANPHDARQTLRADVSVIYDVYGNRMDEEISWEFYFNKNPVGWVGTDISNIIIYEDEEYSTTRILENVGGSSNSCLLYTSDAADE